MDVEQVLAPATPRRYPPLERGRLLDAGRDEADPYFWSGWWRGEGRFRWSRGERSVVVFALAQPGAARLLELEAFCYGKQEVRVSLNGTELDAFSCSHRRPRVWSFEIAAGVLRRHNTLVIEHPDAVSPAELGRSRDSRELAVGVCRLTVR